MQEKIIEFDYHESLIKELQEVKELFDAYKKIEQRWEQLGVLQAHWFSYLSSKYNLTTDDYIDENGFIHRKL